MKPFVKWVGGKLGNWNKIQPLLPQTFNNYYEPFVGGGAILFTLHPKYAIINDINSELINCYNQIKNNCTEVINELISLEKQFNSEEAQEFYYKVRNEFNNDLNSNSSCQAARFIYLNKHGFNGLYRVNKAGKFNVPFNHNTKFNCYNKNELYEISQYLQNVEIYNDDFASILTLPQENDFVFIDSPYDNSFTDYTKEAFKKEDHIRLANMFKDLSNNNVKCMLTNHDTELIRTLYQDYNIYEIDVRRSINSDGNNRTGKEIIITNYKE